MSDTLSIGGFISGERMKKGLSQRELARLTGISNTTVSRIENNEVTPDTETIQKLSTALPNLPDKLRWIFGPVSSEKTSEVDSRICRYSTVAEQWLNNGNEYEYEEFDNIPKGADFALKVRGDSMEPIYSDGDVVFIKANVIVESGQVGVFYFKGEGYLKMLQGNKLVSINQAYNPIVVGKYDAFFCAGRVVGKICPKQKKPQQSRGNKE